MKNKLIFLFGFVISLIVFSTACSKTKSYAEMVKEENNAISRFIQDQELIIVNELPAIPFAEKVFYKTPEGLYLSIRAKGSKTSFSAYPDKVYMTYDAYWFFKSSTTKGGSGNLPEFSYNNEYAVYGSDYLCQALLIPLQEVYGLGHESIVDMIIPSALGTTSQQSSVEPMYYEGLNYTVSPLKVTE